MELIPIKKKRIYQIVIEQIKSAIEKGELKPGDKLLSERDFAEKLAVSRNAVREAISVLESIGLVRIEQGIGVFLQEDEERNLISQLNDIIDKTPINLVELLEVRKGIEGQAAYLAAERRTEADLLHIWQAYEQLKSSVDVKHVAAKEDYLFHAAIVKASHNQMLLQTVKLFSDKFLQGIEASRSDSLKMPGKSVEVLQEHFLIYQSIKEGQPEKAQQAMVQHLQHVRERYLQTEG